jgi:hypothetical protein
MELATAIAAFASLLRQYFVSVNIHRIAFAEAARLAFGTTLTSKAASTASTTSRVLCPMKEDFGISVGTQRTIDGQRRVYYDGYWIKAYEVPADTLTAKKRLIEALTRRLFNHVEHGVNIPGTRLDEARRAFDAETEPRRKRVKGAMLAGALFNRAADVFTKVVEVQTLGIEIRSDNALMRQCGQYLQEALELGQMVLHRSGEEGIDELWGEPFKAFAFPIEEFYKSRYIKIAQTMRTIDRIADELAATFAGMTAFSGIEPLIHDCVAAAKVKCETLHTDPEIFDAWAALVVAAEKLCGFTPRMARSPSLDEQFRVAQGIQLIAMGKDLIFHMTRARVPMPKSTRDYVERLQQFRERTAHAPEVAAWLRTSMAGAAYRT